MKNLTSLFEKGNLTPKERMLLLVQNDVAEETTGKEILTEADKIALSTGWTPKDNYEVKEYNQFNEGWRMANYAKLDSQTIFLSSEILLLRASSLLSVAVWTNYKDKGEDYLKRLEKLDLGVGDGDSLDIILKNSGLDFDRVVYRVAFESLSDDLQNDLLALYPEVKTETDYLNQEEILASLFGKKDKLAAEAKNKLADMIVESFRNRFIEVFKKHGFEYDEFFWDCYYAGLPVIEIAKKWASDNEIYTEGEFKDLEEKGGNELKKSLIKKMKEYENVGEMLKLTVRAWLDDGLFVDDYAPLYQSENKETCNGVDTKLSHKDIFNAWFKAKTSAHDLIQGLINDGLLKVESRKKRGLLNLNITVKIITGESLYALDGDYVFTKDYRLQVDSLKLIGSLVIYLRQHKLSEGYCVMLGFAEIFKRLSKTYEVDLSHRTAERISLLKKDIIRINKEIIYIAENVEMAVYMNHEVTFLIESFIDDILMCPEEMKPQNDENIEYYLEEFKKILGNEF